MPRLSPFGFHALAGAALAACAVYEIPPASDNAPSSKGDGGSASGTSAKGPATGGSSNTAGTSNAAGGSQTSGGTAGTIPNGNGAGTGAVGGAGGFDNDTIVAGAGGAADVTDSCPDDLNKNAPGACGCGLPDAATASFASCTGLVSKLLHRYDFEGSGVAVTDRVGDADGAVVGATLSQLAGRGVVQLGGGASGAYVDLPNRLISVLTNATLEAWITFGGGVRYQRVFDFGDSSSTPEDNPANGKTYLFVSPNGGGNSVVTLGYSLNGNLNGQEQTLLGAAGMPQALSQVAVVADGTGDKLSLYVDGAHVITQAWTGALSSINDVNVWLGRSQFNEDPELTAVYHEFRVYGAALSATEVATAFKAGTDRTFMPK